MHLVFQLAICTRLTIHFLNAHLEVQRREWGFRPRFWLKALGKLLFPPLFLSVSFTQYDRNTVVCDGTLWWWINIPSLLFVAPPSLCLPAPTPTCTGIIHYLWVDIYETDYCNCCFYLFIYWMNVGRHGNAKVHAWRLENNLKELILSFLHVGCRDQTQIIWPEGIYLYCWALLVVHGCF